MINYLVLIKDDTILSYIHYLGTGSTLMISGQGGDSNGSGGGSSRGVVRGGGSGVCSRGGLRYVYSLDESNPDKRLSCVERENQSELLILHLVSPSKIV